jgi:hypothetical protein
MARILMVLAAVTLLALAATQAIGQSPVLPPGTTVDVFSSPGVGKARGKIVSGPDTSSRYRVRYTGCTSGFDEFVDQSLVMKAAQLPRSSPSLRSLIGKWAVFTPSYPARVVKDRDTIRDYRRGRKPAPLTIGAGGRYVWHYDYGHTPIRGRWTTDAKLPGGTGIYRADGIVVRDPQRRPWKLARGVLQRFCSGVRLTATKV